MHVTLERFATYLKIRQNIFLRGIRQNNWLHIIENLTIFSPYHGYSTLQPILNYAMLRSSLIDQSWTAEIHVMPNKTPLLSQPVETLTPTLVSARPSPYHLDPARQILSPLILLRSPDPSPWLYPSLLSRSWWGGMQLQRVLVIWSCSRPWLVDLNERQPIQKKKVALGQSGTTIIFSTISIGKRTYVYQLTGKEIK